MGKLLYLATVTRPDIAAAILSGKLSKTSKMDWNAVKRVIRYLKGTSIVKLKLSASEKSILTRYVDVDWAGDPIDKKSTSGYLFLLSGRPISWTSKKQSIVTLLTTEAEYVAAAHAGLDFLWLRQLQC
ncbi:uncharacterized protein [Dendrobates tinctorius]|uniref:uncharacterized protein n=1 Tax=Dendrobates tinctorius TaxID=92724 RepID=UPI003CC98A85